MFFLPQNGKVKVNPMESSNQFLGTERIGKLMQKYAIPCIISLLVGALYNIVDQIFIANASYLGSYGNAANTVVFPLTVVALAYGALLEGAVLIETVFSWPGFGSYLTGSLLLAAAIILRYPRLINPAKKKQAMIISSVLRRINAACCLVYYSLQLQHCQERI